MKEKTQIILLFITFSILGIVGGALSILLGLSELAGFHIMFSFILMAILIALIIRIINREVEE